MSTAEHKARMANKKAQRAARSSGTRDAPMPAADDARSWNDLNRKHRRAALAKAHAGVPGERRRLKTHTAEVAYWRGVGAHGV
ncbi:hypothetical protein [Stappia phage SI01]|uniref:Uncharacterized protein n=1 Tax=Stappia phage SI01 TaxID=2847766 RepID=A0AAE7VH56_9CAUD|nr:hypothetical protein [Stappia phage SI01]